MLTAAEFGDVAPCDCVLAGLRVASRLPLPGVPAWAGASDHPVDLTIDFGPVPAFVSPTVASGHLQVDASGACRVEIAELAAYRISADGSEVTIELAGARTAMEVRAFLFGSILALACFKRGLLPLHACCVRVGEVAIAFAGRSGAGKSTLAAGLVQRGYAMLADDVTVIDLSGATPVVRPTFPGVKLWQDALERLGEPSEALERVRPTLEKFHLPVDRFCATPLPLAAVVHLETGVDGPPGIRTLGALEGLGLVPQVFYRPYLAVALGLKDVQMSQALRLTSATGGFRAMRRIGGSNDWDRLLADMAAIGG